MRNTRSSKYSGSTTYSSHNTTLGHVVAYHRAHRLTLAQVDISRIATRQDERIAIIERQALDERIAMHNDMPVRGAYIQASTHSDLYNLDSCTVQNINRRQRLDNLEALGKKYIRLTHS